MTMTPGKLYTCDEKTFADYFAQAVCQAEKIRRGTIFDPCGTVFQRHAAYVRGVMLARMRFMTPPIKANVRLRVVSPAPSILTPLEKSDASLALREDHTYEVARVWFEDTNAWSVSLKGSESVRYPLAYFDVVPADAELALAG